MKYTHLTMLNGDGISKTLLEIRKKYGDNWTDKMAFYAIGKCRKIPALKWREPATNPYIKKQFVQI